MMMPFGPATGVAPAIVAAVVPAPVVIPSAVMVPSPVMIAVPVIVPAVGMRRSGDTHRRDSQADGRKDRFHAHVILLSPVPHRVR